MKLVLKKIEQWSAILLPLQEIFERKWSFRQQGCVFCLYVDAFSKQIDCSVVFKGQKIF
jgi:hypothetical protein